MSSLARRFFVFVFVLGVLFLTAFVSFRCGVSQGYKDAPRYHYSVDVARSIRDNPDFRRYVDSLYVSTYISVMDSVIRTDKVIGLVMNWLDNHPGCQLKTERAVKTSVGDLEGVFFK